MKILVVSGSLGAGKTTFIQMLAKRLHKDFVVYENEFGEADLDARTLRQDAKLEVYESSENCICCTGKQDFASSVLTIYNSLNPEILVVEPTGVAKLSSVIENIKQISYGDMELLSPITVVDATSWQAHKAQLASIFDDQLDMASTIVISKVGSDRPDDLLGYLEKHSKAEILYSRYEDIPDAILQELLDNKSLKESANAQHVHDELDLETFSLGHVELENPALLISFLEDMVRGAFGNIVRAKGIVSTPKEALRFDVVNGMWAITATEDKEEPVCICIGTEINKNAVRRRVVPLIWRDSADIHHAHDHEHDHEHAHEH